MAKRKSLRKGNKKSKDGKRGLKKSPLKLVRKSPKKSFRRRDGMNNVYRPYQSMLTYPTDRFMAQIRSPQLLIRKKKKSKSKGKKRRRSTTRRSLSLSEFDLLR